MITLETFSQKHLDQTFDWMQDEELRKNFLLRKPITKDTHKAWFENYKKTKHEKIFAILSDGVHVGNIGLKNIDEINKSADNWIYIGNANYLKKGISHVAYNQLFDILKNEGSIKTISCPVASFNNASMNMLTKLGFTRDFSFSEKQEWNGEAFELLKFVKTI